MPRYRLTIEYDGGPFHGFQAQDGVPSVQAAIEAAITGFSGESPRVFVSGRTDTGVHATGQVIHFDLEKPRKPDVIRDALNAYMVEQAVVVLDAAEADPDFHARFSAIGRRYLYRILDRRSPPAIDAGRVWWVKMPLDLEAMQAAAPVLEGTHDFTTFRDSQCQANSPVKTVDEIRIVRVGLEIHLHFAARSFLHRQVRSMTGALAKVGKGQWSRDRLVTALEARDRNACAPVAPAHGLYLTGVVFRGED